MGAGGLKGCRHAQMKIVHFDLKPDNLLLEAPLVPGAGLGVPSVKVADFGLSKHKWKSYVSGVRDLRCAPGALICFSGLQVLHMR